MKNLLFIVPLAGVVAMPAYGWNNSSCSELQSDYTRALAAYTNDCSSAFLTQYSGYFMAMQAGICSCLNARTSANNCVALKQLCCQDDTEFSSIVGTTELWYERTWVNSSVCSTVSTYRCRSGYYGTATGAGTGCTKCPDNATCPGGKNPSRFGCNISYYKSTSSATSCSRCPTATNIFINSAKTVRAVGTTAEITYDGTGSTLCYLPTGTYYDNTGTFQITTNQACYY